MDLSLLLKAQREFFLTHATWPVAFRVEALRRLAAAIQSREAEILTALYQDLRKSPHEAYASEVGWVLSEIDHAIRHLKRWMKPQKRRAPGMAWFSSAQVIPEPRGIALIMGPWNYPLQLLLSPLIGAIAAGNCAVLKTSELAPHSSAIMAQLIGDAFEPYHVALVRGDQEISKAVLALRFDTIFFTGSSRVGREVMAAASQNLTPVILELGGKCPCIVCEDADIEQAARRIIWGKMMNAGQTCVAPDYVLVHSSRYEELIDSMKSAIERFYSASPQRSPDFGRIINQHHFDRLTGYLNEGTVVSGGQSDAADLYIAPTLLTHPSPGSAVMTEEIFGPILPILPIQDFEQALQFAHCLPTPLSAYLFTHEQNIQKRVMSVLRCGSLCINDVAMQLFGKDLAFGGLGDSGLGAYHGKASFEAFTHFKSVLHCSTRIDPSQRYPPTILPMKRFKKVIRFLLRK